MSKKVDLNAPRKVQNDYKKSRNNHSFSHGTSYNVGTNNTEIPNDVNDGNDVENTSTGGKGKFGQNIASAGLRLAGLSKNAARRVSNYTENMDTSDKVKALLKFLPPQVKVVLVAVIIGLPLVGLFIFVVLFSNAEAANVDDYLSLAETCSMVTVTDTGCDSNGNNCTHEYDGEVNFEDYIAGVVAGLSDGANDKEFYKTLAVVARTYFLGNASSDCQVVGNNTFMEYKSIDVASDKGRIKDAVSDTARIVLVNEDNGLVDVNYSMACVINNTNSNYYLRYGINENNYQQISTSFDSDSQIYRGKLNSLYNTVDKSNNNLDSRLCPSGNESEGLSLIGALYLATNDNYDYEKILNYYYGDVSLVRAEGTFSGNQVDGFINPVSNLYKCTSSFGCRIHPISGGYRYHSGIDIPVVEGTPVYAAKAGKVTAVRRDVTGYLAGSYGNYVDIDHMDGTMTRYAHLKYGGLMVSVGMMVNQGQAIALSGNTGGSTGPHLHYEVHVNGVPVDPYNYLDKSVIGDANSCNYGQSVPASYCGR